MLKETEETIEIGAGDEAKKKRKNLGECAVENQFPFCMLLFSLGLY